MGFTIIDTVLLVFLLTIPLSSVTVKLNFSKVLLIRCGAVNDGFELFLFKKATGIPDTCFQE